MPWRLSFRCRDMGSEAELAIYNYLGIRYALRPRPSTDQTLLAEQWLGVRGADVAMFQAAQYRQPCARTSVLSQSEGTDQ